MILNKLISLEKKQKERKKNGGNFLNHILAIVTFPILPTELQMQNLSIKCTIPCKQPVRQILVALDSPLS